jgi:putative hemolysin
MMPLTSGAIMGMVVVAILLFFSAMISGSEVAYFSLSPLHMRTLKEHPARKEVLALRLLERPERLLACILISNNFINVAL